MLRKDIHRLIKDAAVDPVSKDLDSKMDGLFTSAEQLLPEGNRQAVTRRADVRQFRIRPVLGWSVAMVMLISGAAVLRTMLGEDTTQPVQENAMHAGPADMQTGVVVKSIFGAVNRDGETVLRKKL